MRAPRVVLLLSLLPFVAQADTFLMEFTPASDFFSGIRADITGPELFHFPTDRHFHHGRCVHHL